MFRKATYRFAGLACAVWLGLSPAAAEQSLSADQTNVLFVAHALHKQRTDAPDLALLTDVALSIIDSGGSVDAAKQTIDKVTGALLSRRIALKALGVIGFDDTLTDAREKYELILALPGALSEGAGQILRRKRLAWDNSLSEGLVSSPNSMYLTTKSSLETLREQQISSISEIQRRYRAGQSQVREIFDARLVTTFAIKPDSVASALLKEDFAKQPFVASLIAKMQTGEGLSDLKETYAAQMTSFQQATRQQIDKLQQTISSSAEDLVLQKLGDKAGLDAKRIVADAQRLKDGVELGNADAGVYIASALVGAFDKKLGRDIHRVGMASIEVAKIVKGIRDSQAVEGASGAQIGMAAATGGYSAIFMLVAQMAISSDAGPSADELILGQLQALQEQIAALGQRMDARFDRVDAALELIYNEMKTGYGLIDRQLKGISDEQDQIAMSIQAQDMKLGAMTAEILEALNRLRDANASILLAPCQRWNETSVTIALPADTFVECLARLASDAENVDPEPANAHLDAKSLVDSLSAKKSPTENLRFLARLAANEGYGLIPGLSEQLLGSPSHWAATTKVYEKLATGWPDLFYGTPLAQARRMARSGNTMYSAVRALRSVIGQNWIRTLGDKYRDAATAHATNLRNFRVRLDNPNEKFWMASTGDVAIPYCKDSPLRVGESFVYMPLSVFGQQSTLRMNRVSAYFPALIDELERAGVGEAHHCIGAEYPEGGSMTLRFLGWFVIPPLYDQAKLAAIKAKYGANASWMFEDAEIEPKRIMLIHDAKLNVQGNYSLPTQFCGIVCQPPWDPVIAANITDAWNKSARGSFEGNLVLWASPHRKQLAEKGLKELAAYALTRVASIRSRYVNDAHALSQKAPEGCALPSGPVCAPKVIEGLGLAVRNYFQLGYSDALNRNDVLRELLLGQNGLISEGQLNQWALQAADPIQVAETVEKRSAAVRQLVLDEIEISVKRSAYPHGELQRAALRMDEFVADILRKCAANQHHPAACKDQ